MIRADLQAAIDRTRILLSNDGTSEGAKKGWETRRGGAPADANTVVPAEELAKRPVSEAVKINPWDDERTRKMKMRLAKMHADNLAMKADIEERKAALERARAALAARGQAGA